MIYLCLTRVCGYTIKILHKNPNLVLLLEKNHFLSQPVLGIYVKNPTGTGNSRRKSPCITYVKEKIYREILVSLSMLFVHLFVYTRECERSTEVGVEPDSSGFKNYSRHSFKNILGAILFR